MVRMFMFYGDDFHKSALASRRNEAMEQISLYNRCTGKQTIEIKFIDRKRT